MTVQRLTSLARAYTAGVGMLDVGSGLALVAAPAWTLPLMGVTVPEEPAALGYVRFLGGVVAGMGAMYLTALAGPRAWLRPLLTLTLPLRLLVGGVAAVGVVAGWIDSGWVLVAVADALLVMAQGVLLVKGAGRDDG